MRSLHSSSQVPDEQAARYLITAPDAETIDEWWRAVSDPSKKDLGYQRHSPDFYTYSKLWPYDAAPEFISRIIFTLLNDRNGRIQSLFPHQERTDVRSGQTFFVRSKSKPNMFWLVGSGGSITASTTYRSRFRFDIDGEENGTVIIGKDVVSIHYVTGKQGVQGAVAVQNDKLCINNDHKYPFHFSDFKDVFLSSHDYKQDSVVSGQSSLIFVMEKGHGEEWELVK